MKKGDLDMCCGCGHFIALRYIGGKVRPMGCTCSGKKGGKITYQLHTHRLRSVKCKECGDKIYPYRNPNGGFAWFETLWPDWDLHEHQHPRDKILEGEKVREAVGNQFWIRAIMIPRNCSRDNCLLYGYDRKEIGLLMEITAPNPHRYNIAKVVNELLSIQKKSGRKRIIETTWEDREQWQFTTEVRDTQGAFDFLGDPFPGKILTGGKKAPPPTRKMKKPNEHQTKMDFRSS